MPYKGSNFKPNSRPYDPTKVRKFVHSPFTTEHEDVHVSVDRMGQVTISKPAEDSNDEEDVIIVPASLIFKLNNMLVHFPFTVEHQGIHAAVGKDGKLITMSRPVLESLDSEVDEVVVPSTLITKLSDMLASTRKVHYVNKE